MIEEWRVVADFEGLYEISSFGRVKSLEKTVCGPGNIGLMTLKEKILKGSKTPRGYPQITLCSQGKRVTYYIHRLVASAFIPNPESKKQVNHINANKLDNNVINLEWCTPGENLRHCLDLGLRVMPSGSQHWKNRQPKGAK